MLGRSVRGGSCTGRMRGQAPFKLAPQTGQPGARARGAQRLPGPPGSWSASDGDTAFPQAGRERGVRVGGGLWRSPCRGTLGTPPLGGGSRAGTRTANWVHLGLLAHLCPWQRLLPRRRVKGTGTQTHPPHFAASCEFLSPSISAAGPRRASSQAVRSAPRPTPRAGPAPGIPALGPAVRLRRVPEPRSSDFQPPVPTPHHRPCPHDWTSACALPRPLSPLQVPAPGFLPRA